MLHFWAVETEREALSASGAELNPKECLQQAYEQTLEHTLKPNEWHGTTTACGALITSSSFSSESEGTVHPTVYVTNLGDSQVLVIRPSQEQILYKTVEQWHWFDCPRQLGTNSPDIPREEAVVAKVDVEDNDVVLAMSDGVVDNLWEHEVVSNVSESIRKWQAGEKGAEGGMQFVADELMNAARVIAQDPFAESPFMERAIEEGLAMEGGEFCLLGTAPN
jgi:serine/threonine protein phosphatase PrpC